MLQTVLILGLYVLRIWGLLVLHRYGSSCSINLTGFCQYFPFVFSPSFCVRYVTLCPFLLTSEEQTLIRSVFCFGTVENSVLSFFILTVSSSDISRLYKKFLLPLFFYQSLFSSLLSRGRLDTISSTISIQEYRFSLLWSTLGSRCFSLLLTTSAVRLHVIYVLWNESYRFCSIKNSRFYCISRQVSYTPSFFRLLLSFLPSLHLRTTVGDGTYDFNRWSLISIRRTSTSTHTI